MAKKVKETTLEEKIQANNTELIKAISSALNTAILTREGLNHATIVMDHTQRLCKEADNGLKIQIKRYNYLKNKVADLDRVISALIPTVEKTLGLSGVKRNLDEACGIYSDIYDCVEIEDTQEIVK